MSWPKPETRVLPCPEKPRYVRWFSLLCFLVIISVSVYTCFWPDDRCMTQPVFWIVSLFSGATLGGLVVCLRCYAYGLALEKHEIWRQEQQVVERNWQRWAQKKCAILSSYLLMPTALTAERIVCDRPNLTNYVDRSLAFAPELDLTAAMEALISHFQPILTQLIGCPLTVTLYASESAYLDLKERVECLLAYLKLDVPYHVTQRILMTTATETLTEIMEKSSIGAHLIVINNTRSDALAFLSGVLLGDPNDLKSSLSVKYGAAVLRPMITTQTGLALKQMTELQIPIKTAKGVWLGNISKQKEITLLKLLAENGISPEEVYLLNSLAGNQNFLCYWFALVLASEVANHTKMTQLLITGGSHEECIFSTLIHADEMPS